MDDFGDKYRFDSCGLLFRLDPSHGARPVAASFMGVDLDGYGDLVLLRSFVEEYLGGLNARPACFALKGSAFALRPPSVFIVLTAKDHNERDVLSFLLLKEGQKKFPSFYDTSQAFRPDELYVREQNYPAEVEYDKSDIDFVVELNKRQVEMLQDALTTCLGALCYRSVAQRNACYRE